jgi:hypothetical protein
MESLIEVAVPPISPPTNENNTCGLNAFINDADEVKMFRHLPDTLILRAGIFGFNGKYPNPIPIVPEFDIRTYHQPDWQPTNAGSTVYRLQAIVCHHGETIDAGHYTALVLRDGMWYHIDDAPPTATIIDLPAELPAAQVDTLQNANPYIFFYVRDGTGPYVVADDGTSEPAALPPAAAAPPAPPAAPPAAPAAVNGWSRVSPVGPAERDRQAAAQARNPTVQQKTKKDRKDRKRGRKTRKRSKH